MGVLADHLAAWPVPAAAGAVLVGGEVVETAGDTAAPFRLASVTKFLTAVVAAVAVEEGSIGYETPAGPEGSTLAHLLAHASGLGAEVGDRDRPVADRRVYSNQGFEVAGSAIGAAAGMAFAEYWHLALVDGLGLSATRLDGSPAHAGVSCVDDLAAVVTALHTGTLLAPETVTTMRTPAFPDLAGILPGYGRQDPNPWGLGVEVRGDKSPHWTGSTNSAETWGHFGQSGTFVWIDPVADVATVVLTDRDFGPWAIDAWPPCADAVLGAH